MQQSASSYEFGQLLGLRSLRKEIADTAFALQDTHNRIRRFQEK
jgi:hypothetical protein